MADHNSIVLDVEDQHSMIAGFFVRLQSDFAVPMTDQDVRDIAAAIVGTSWITNQIPDVDIHLSAIDNVPITYP